MPQTQPFHSGELLVQKRSGDLALGRHNGQVIQDSILHGALGFIAQQSFAVLGSLDPEGRVWASILLGQPGFIRPIDSHTVEIDLPQAVLGSQDPLGPQLDDHPDVGMLLIELERRRRWRLNGRLHRQPNGRLRLEVRESYPNCPKYIQRRFIETPESSDRGTPSVSEDARQGTVLTEAQRDFITKADTFFVASAHPDRGVDASHRGGAPGFVQVFDDGTLRIPDFAGNGMYNTLGNFAVYPRAGLVFLDFESGRTLQLTGSARIRWDLDDPEGATGGTRRFWDFQVEGWVEHTPDRSVRWTFSDFSPYNP